MYAITHEVVEEVVGLLLVELEVVPHVEEVEEVVFTIELRGC